MKAELSHEPLSQLLPWYVNGTLSPEERHQVEEHLKSCDACQRELQLLRNTSAAMSDLDAEVPEVNVNLSLAKTLGVMESLEKATAPAPRRKLAGWFDVLWNPPVPVARLVFAAQMVLIVGLGIYALTPRATAPNFTTLSETEQTGGGARLTINFAPNTTVQQMNQILTAVGGRIVAGPSALGIYVVELPVAAEKDAAVQAVVSKLRMNDAIRFVERQP